MITARNLIETVISLRLYVWEKDGLFLLYESLPEEGEGVKKRLGKFESREKLDAFRAEYEKELKVHLESVISVKVKSQLRKKMKEPPSPKSIKEKLCSSSPSTLKLPDSTHTSTESSSSPPSTPI